MTTNATRRRCNGPTCIAILRRDNDDPDGLCGACRMKATDRMVARLREQMEEREAKEAERQARITAGLPANGVPRTAYDRDMLIGILHRMTDELGRVPTSDDCGGQYPSREVFHRHFGSWTKARLAAGLTLSANTRDLILECLADGRALSAAEIAEEIGRARSLISRLMKDLEKRGRLTHTSSRTGQQGQSTFHYSLVERDGA